MLNWLITGPSAILIAAGSFSGTGIVHMTGGVFDSAAYLGAADTVLVTNHAGTDTSWIAPGGDLSYASGSFTVKGLQTRPVASTAPTDGQVLTWVNGAGQWQPTTLPTPALTAYGSDLAGSTATNQWVGSISGTSGLGGNVALNTPLLQFGAAQPGPGISQAQQTGNNPTNGLFLAAQNASATGTGGNRVGGNLNFFTGAGTSGADQAGSFLIQLATSSAHGFFRVNDGGSGTVATIGINGSGFPAMSMGTAALSAYALQSNAAGDNVTLNSATTLFFAIAGTSQANFTSTTLTFTGAPFVKWDKAAGAPFIAQNNQTTDTATNNFTIQAQGAWPNATVNITGGSLILNGGASAGNPHGIAGDVVASISGPGVNGDAEGHFVVKRSGTTCFRIGFADANSPGNQPTIYMGTGVNSNYLVTSDSAGVNVIFNGGQTLSFDTGNSPAVVMTTSKVQFALPIGGQAGNGLSMQLAASGTVTLAAGTVTLTAAQYSCPYIPCNGASGAGVTIVFPSQVSLWILDMSGATLTGAVTVKCGTGAKTFSPATSRVLVYSDGANSMSGVSLS